MRREGALGDLISDFPVSVSGARGYKGMGTHMDKTPGDATDPIDRLRSGGRRALAQLFDQDRDRLGCVVQLRIDARLRARLDASDALQEAILDLARDLDAYLADLKLAPLLWLRLHAGRRLTTFQRQHVGTKTVSGPFLTRSACHSRS